MRRDESAQCRYLVQQSRLARRRGRHGTAAQYLTEAATLRLLMIRKDLYR